MMTPPFQYGDMNTQYDPLAARFMTGNQMGAMPQAQYLTPSQYGAFRTMPMPNNAVMPLQRPSLWQSYNIANRGTLGGMLPAYSLSNYQMGVDQSLYQTMAARRVDDAKSAFRATTTNLGMNLGISTAIGLGNPLIGLGVAALMPDLMAPYTDRIAQMRKIQYNSMSKITSGRDVAGVGQGFTARAASGIDEFIRKEAAGDVLFKEDDYREMMRSGVEGGLFDYSNSAKQYKQTLKKMKDNIKAISDIFGSTDYKQLTEEMKRMMTLGADASQTVGIASKERMFARMTGLRHEDMVASYGQQGAMSYMQRGLSGYQGSLDAMSNAANVTLAQRLGLITPGQLSLMGGVSGLTQNITDSKAENIKNAQKGYLAYFANNDFSGLAPDAEAKMAAVMRGDVSYTEMMQRGSEKFKTVQDAVNYDANERKLQLAMDTVFGAPKMAEFISKIAVGVGRVLSGGAAITDKDALTLGYMGLGDTAEIAKVKTDMATNPEMIRSNLHNAETEDRRLKQSIMERVANEQSWWNRKKLGAADFLNRIEGATYGPMVDRGAADSDIEENARLGIFQETGAALGFNDDMASNTSRMYVDSWDRMGKVKHELKNKQPSRLEYFYQLGGGSELISSTRPRTASQFAKEQATQDGVALLSAYTAMNGEGLSINEVKENLSGYADNLNVEELQKELAKLDDASTLTTGKLKKVIQEAIRKSTDFTKMSKKEGTKFNLFGSADIAEEIYNDEGARNNIYNLASTVNPELSNKVAALHKERIAEIHKSHLKVLADWDAGFAKDLKEITTHKYFMGDGQQGKMLEDSMGKDFRALDIYSMQVLLSKYKNSHNRRDKKKIRGLLEETGGRLHMSPKSIAEVVESEGGLNDPNIRIRQNDNNTAELQVSLPEFFSKHSNLNTDEYTQLTSAGEKTAASLGTDAEAIELATKAAALSSSKFMHQAEVRLENYNKILANNAITFDELLDPQERARQRSQTTDSGFKELLDGIEREAKGRIGVQAKNDMRFISHLNANKAIDPMLPIDIAMGEVSATAVDKEFDAVQARSKVKVRAESQTAESLLYAPTSMTKMTLEDVVLAVKSGQVPLQEGGSSGAEKLPNTIQLSEEEKKALSDIQTTISGLQKALDKLSPIMDGTTDVLRKAQNKPGVTWTW